MRTLMILTALLLLAGCEAAREQPWRHHPWGEKTWADTKEKTR